MAPEITTPFLSEGLAAEFPGAAKLLSGYDPPDLDAGWLPGDRVLFGLRLRDGEDRRLWLVRLEVQTGKKHVVVSQKNGLVQEESWSHKVDLTTPDGRKIEIASDLMEVAVEVFDENGSPLDWEGKLLKAPGLVVRTSSLVPERFLRNGFYAASREALRLQEIQGARPRQDLNFSAEIARQLPDETYKLLAAGLVALPALFKPIQDTRSLVPIVNSVLEKPSLLSVISHLGVRFDIVSNLHLAVLERTPLSPSANPGAYSFPIEFKLNGSPALNCRLWVVPPESPYHLCAGVVSVEAVHPFKAEKRLSMHLLAARRGSPAPKEP